MCLFNYLSCATLDSYQIFKAELGQVRPALLGWGTSWEKPGAEAIASRQMILIFENHYTAYAAEVC